MALGRTRRAVDTLILLAGMLLAWQAIFLTFLVLLFFLRNLRSSLIVAVSIPVSMLVTPSTEVAKPRFPAIDVHNHLGSGKTHLTPERVAAYLTEMNEAGVRTVVNLDGGWGERLAETLAALDRAHPGDLPRAAGSVLS